MPDGKRRAEEEEESGGETESTAPPSGGKKGGRLIGIIVGVVFGLAALGGGGFFVFTQLQPAEASEEGVEEEQPAEQDISETNIYFDGFATNIANLEVSEDYDFMYLKYGFEVEVDSQKVIQEIVTKLPKLTSKAAGVMSNRNWNEICTPQGRERLARECLAEINDELSTGKCIALYFTTFVAQ
jgi:flagellar basal body-associated protein FliL